MERQQQMDWCWAAVAVAVYQFMNAGGTKDITQGSLASQVLAFEGQIAQGTNCQESPGLCDFSAALDDALNETGDLLAKGSLVRQYLYFNSLTGWIDQHTPVAARILWFGCGAHFIVLYGYRTFDTGEQFVFVHDPLYGPSFQTYDGLVNYYPPGGVWQDTYLVK
jgi:hypothetical protein